MHHNSSTPSSSTLTNSESSGQKNVKKRVEEMSVFNGIHKLIRRSRLSLALEILIDSDSDRLKEKYLPYANHASYLIGQIYTKKKNYTLEVKAYKNALKFEPEDTLAMWGLANCYVELGSFLKAKNLFQIAVKLKPRDARLKYNLANAFFDLGQINQAIPIYRKLIRSRNSEIAIKAKKNMRLAIAELNNTPAKR
jgi:tetratricopeptide (TPR) repeat protein